MADMLVDSTKLDACLDAEADAIRAKTGGSADLTFDFANNKGFADAIASIQTGGGGFHEIGTVSFHTGAVLQTLTIPISAEAESLDNYVIAVRPIKTWALVDGVWVERDSLDFTGINGFRSGSWHPVLSFLIGGKVKAFNNFVSRVFLSRSKYSDGTAANANKATAAFSLVDGNLVTSPTDALNGGCVCVADGGLTFEYQIWGWS